MRGDIFLVDDSGEVQHPWLIVQAEALNQEAAHTIALPLASRPQTAPWPLTVELPPEVTTLPGRAWVQVTHPTRLRRDRLVGPISTLDDTHLTWVFAALREVFDLPG